MDASIEGLTLRDNQCDHGSLRLFQKRFSYITCMMGCFHREVLVKLVNILRHLRNDSAQFLVLIVTDVKLALPSEHTFS